MIQVKSTNSKYQTVKATIFPDNTSQMWHLDLKDLRDNYPPKDFKNEPTVEIKWNFENEAELIHVWQLTHLLRAEKLHNITLYVPYFPYARQDKLVSNETTFSRASFISFLISLHVNVKTYDIHSPLLESEHARFNFENLKPLHILEAIEIVHPHFIFFPDEGALKRYTKIFEEDINKFSIIPKLYATKNRNQSTGLITDYKVNTPSQLLSRVQGATVLIVDDLADGGATFIVAAQELKKLGVTNIDLCVSHGLFSKGREVLHEAGIRNIYTTNSILKNEKDYKV